MAVDCAGGGGATGGCSAISAVNAPISARCHATAQQRVAGGDKPDGPQQVRRLECPSPASRWPRGAARRRRLVRSNVVRTITRMRPSRGSEAIRRVAVDAIHPGIRTSISTTSGRSALASATAMPPFGRLADDGDVRRRIQQHAEASP